MWVGLFNIEFLEIQCQVGSSILLVCTFLSARGSPERFLILLRFSHLGECFDFSSCSPGSFSFFLFFSFIWVSMSLNQCQWVSMSLYESLWVSMSLNEFPWVSMRLNEFPWVSMRLKRFSWVSMSLHDSPWDSMTFHESLWVSMILNESLWVSRIFHESPWVSMSLNEFPWVSKSLHEFQRGIWNSFKKVPWRRLYTVLCIPLNQTCEADLSE